jgi:hypothetical protein
MLDDEVARQQRLQAKLARDPATASWIEEPRLFQAYKQLQFVDTLALYFNRVHPSERGESRFEHVPLSATEDTSVTVRPHWGGVYEVAPYPFAADAAEFAFAGRPIAPGQGGAVGGWAKALAASPTVWERFRLVAG